MYVHWEQAKHVAGDANIKSLSWMGRVPDRMPEEEGFKLNRQQYYQEGWLGVASLRGLVGVTYTTSHCGGVSRDNVAHQAFPSIYDPPSRTNYNLRGHRAAVSFVCWNEPYQKLATCDESGVIFVWIKYEGRWSIELINDRKIHVNCFAWSHDGRMALICYEDNFVLVGSVQGQRYWATMLPHEPTMYDDDDASRPKVSCGSWTPDDQQLYLATDAGSILVMDVVGNVVGGTVLRRDVGIRAMQWNCERFNMDEHVDMLPPNSPIQRRDGKPWVLAVAFQDGQVQMLNSYDDLIPQVIESGLSDLVLDWSHSGEVLALAGRRKDVNVLQMYNDQGSLLFSSQISSQNNHPVTALTWAHLDRRLFLATGNRIHVGWVTMTIPSLQLLSRLTIHKSLSLKDDVQLLPLPCRMQNMISMLFSHTIRCLVPDPSSLVEFTVKCHSKSSRLYCTMIKHSPFPTSSNVKDDEATTYTLYLEHLGGYLPLLKGRKVSKLRPDFVIYEPNLSGTESQNLWLSHQACQRKDSSRFLEPTSAGKMLNTLLSTPLLRRRNNNLNSNQTSYDSSMQRRRHSSQTASFSDCVNVLPEENVLAEVTSNFWGTKFEVLSCDLSVLPSSSLVDIAYKASLLHLQPRQMRLNLTDLGEDPSDPFYFGGGWDSSDDDEGANDDDEFSTLRQGVAMKADILRATVPDEAETVERVAPVAPLPTRLSFCLPPSSRPPIVQSEERRMKSPVKTVVTNAIAKAEGLTISEEAIEPGASPSKARGNPSPLRALRTNSPSKSPCKRKLHISLSCDNYLSDGKLSSLLTRRDSVGSGSPHSSRGSPRRWAAKADELLTPDSLDTILDNDTEASVIAPRMTKSVNYDLIEEKENDVVARSTSAHHLDAIVDLLGAPSEATTNKRVFLNNEGGATKSIPNLGTIGKSKSCQENKEDTVRRRRPKKHADSRKNIELKRRSVYARHCRGRSEAKTCTNCEIVAEQVGDGDLNKEIFDVVKRLSDNEDEDEEEKPEIKIDPLPAIKENIPSRTKKFDSVRHLLEKASKVLLFTKLRGRSRSRKNESDVSCSSPNTPLVQRKRPEEKRTSRNKSFSPVRAILNSPLLRRKKYSLPNEQIVKRKLSRDDELEQEENETSGINEFKNLETFQKRQLNQKLKKTERPSNPTPAPTPQFMSPFLPRKAHRNPSIAHSPLLPSHHHVQPVIAAPPPVKLRRRRRLLLRNKSPMWNDTSQVYQLDFGGRVTQESAKNFQIEYRDTQVMQFGRIENNAYTLDFQYPFTAIQAFGVALANVTQRLK